MTPYSTDDAIRELGPALDKAPPGAVKGEWIATTMQAGSSSCGGSYLDKAGDPIGPATFDLKVIGEVVEKLEALAATRFNKATVRWEKSKIPFMRGRVTLDLSFDETIVPRSPDDPIYDVAAATRRAFWTARGEVADGFAAERGEANIYNQTKWFGPHRRTLLVRTPGKVLLATDGLSTPWAGIAERENGVECELFLELSAGMDGAVIDDWANLLISIGDLVADGYRVARDIEKHGAILFCRLSDDFSPMTRMVLSRERTRIENMPFGAVPLIRATPIEEAEIDGQDISDDWGAGAARNALEKRGIGL